MKIFGMRHIRIRVASLLGCSVLATVSLAQAQNDLPSPEAIRQAMVIENQDDPAYLIGKELRCPICQGRPIADSPSDMAQDMMRLLRKKLAEGKSREEILDFFVQSYGESVLLKPRAKGVTSMVWWLPPLVVLGLLFFALSRLRERKSQTGPSQSSAAEKHDNAGESSDPYLQAVRQELDR